MTFLCKYGIIISDEAFFQIHFKLTLKGGKKLNKLAEMINKGEILVEDLANAGELIDRARLIRDGIDACRKTLVFPIGQTRVRCYHYVDSAGEYEAWGFVTWDGTFSCCSNWGGNHQVGKVNLFKFEEVFMAFENEDFAPDLSRFLREQIEKAN